MAVSNHTDEPTVPSATTFGAGGAAVYRLLNRVWVVPSALAVICLLAYVPFLAMSPLLDEQFLLAFCRAAGHHGVALGSFIGWHGPDVGDLWGPATTTFLKVSHILMFGSPFLLRAQSLIIHIVSAVLLFLVTRRMTDGRWLPFAAAALFALYPLNPESVLWLGGKGSELGGMLALASIYAYQQTDWRWLIASLLLYGGALLCSASVWPLAFLFTVWELFSRFVWRRSGTGRDGTLAIVAPLGFFVLAAAYIAGSGLLFQLGTAAAPDMRPSAVFQTLRGCFLPINESIYPHYIRHYRFLYIVMAPLLVSLIVGMVRDGKLRDFVAFCAFWLALLLVPLFGHVDARGTMYGSHLLYASRKK